MSTNRAAPLYYVPSAAEEPGWSIDQANMQGADWLMQQSGQKLVLVNLVQEYQQNRMSSRTQGAVVAKPSTLWKANWQRGPVLAPWPTRDTLSALVDDLHGRATAVCVIEWGTEPLPAAWLRARRAVNVVDGSEYPGADEPLLDPVVEAAMTELGQSVNHGNVFSGTDKARAVHTLQKLYQAGYRWDVDHMCGWALANGFTGAEEDRLREYATKVLRRSPFSPQPTDPYSPGAIERWQDQASQPPA